MLDREHTSQKLEEGGFPRGSDIHDAVMDVFIALDQRDLSKEERNTVLNIVSEFGRSDLIQFPPYGEDAWEEFDYGNVRPGDYVKVRPDAYDSETGSQHNGRVGVLTTLSGRRARVRYLTETTPGYMSHPIGNLLSVKYVIQLKVQKES